MKLHLPKGLRLALLGAIMACTVAYGAEPVYENMTTGTSVSSGETVWAPSTEVEKVSYKNNTVSGYGNGVLEMELGSAGSKSLTITGLESVEFSGNTDTNTSGNDGGTIMMDSDGGENVLNINENDTVNFSQNTVSASGDYKNSYGAAIYMNGNCYAYITNNKDVTFKDNSVFSAAEENKYKGMTYGGAIYVTNSYISNADATLDVSNNTGTVLFEGNSVKTGNSHAYGGAICTSSDATLTLNGNNELIFRNNVAESTSANALGGAISSDGAYGASDGNIFEISGNTKVSFEGNAALGSPQNSTHKVQGGAIYTYKKGFAITGNESVRFTGNYVSAEEGTAEGYANVQGGAIYVRQGMKIQGNDNVLFAGNYEKTGSDYRMRSIYGTSDTGYYVSANKDGKVEFRDGFSLTALNRNGDHNLYLNSAYNDTAQTGTITMTGAYTEGMLEEIKGEGQVSDAEIAASQRFEVSGKTQMQGGTLEVVDSANYAGNGFEVAEEANATVRLRDSIFDHGSAEINFTSGSSLIVEGGATVNAGTLTLASGSTLSVDACVTEFVATNGIIAGSIANAEIGATVNVSLTLDSDYLSSLASESELSIKLLGASVATGDYTVGNLEYVGLDTTFWSEGTLTLDLRENGLYVIGTLTRNTEIIIDEEKDMSLNITDTPDEKAVSVKVTADATLSGDNSYSGGTTITDADVTLASATALGKGEVTVSGESSLASSEGSSSAVEGILTVKEDATVTMSGNLELKGAVSNDGSLAVEGTVETKDTITNKGSLTVGGMLYVSKTIENEGTLVLNGVVDASGITKDVVEETFINTAGATGNDGFKRDAGQSITLVNNSGTITTGDSLSLLHGETAFTLDTTTGIAYVHGETHYGTYFINSADHSVALSTIQTASGNATTLVEMKAGSLTADAGDIEVATTGGTLTTSSGKVSGSIADTSIAAQGGEIVANITGSSKVDVTADTTLSGTNGYTGGTSVTESTLTLGSADALGEGSIVTSGTSAITVAEGISANLKSTITNTGDLTLDGQMDASALTKDAVDETHLNTAGETGNDGFKRDAGSSITLVNNSGSLSTGSAWGVTHSGTTYTLDTTTGIAYAHGTTHYGTYFINSADHSVAVSAIQTASGNATTLVEMKAGSLTADAGDIEVAATGGTLTTSSGKVSGSIADTSIAAQGGEIVANITGSSKVDVTADTTLSGTNSYTGGTSVTESTLTLGSADALGEGSIVTSGTSAITVAEGITANLKSTITNTGDLTLDGQMDASALTKDTVDETYLNTAGETGNDGFKRDAGSSITLVNNSGSLSTGSAWGVTHSGTTYTLDTTTGIAYAHGETHYGTYFINSADHSVAVSAIQAASGDATTKVEMKTGSLTADSDVNLKATGGALTVDASATVTGSMLNTNISLVNGEIDGEIKGGMLTTTSGKVTGSMTDVYVAAQGGEIAAGISGDSTVNVSGDTTLSGANSYTGDTSVTDATLTLGSTDALGAGDITTGGASAITVAEGITANLKTSITNTGDLTLDGKMDASALTKDTVDETHLNTAGETGHDGFKRDAGSSITLVNNSGSITTGSSWGVTHSGTTYTLDTTTGIAYAHGTTHYGTYFINSADHNVAVSAIQAASSNATTKVEMKAGSLSADAGDIEVATTGGTLTTTSGKVSGSIADTTVSAQGGEITADISGKSTVAVTGNTTLSGTNSYTGGTVIDGAELTVTKDNGLGSGEVTMKNHAVLDLSGAAISNRIVVYGCTLKGGHSYSGNLEVDGGELTLTDPTCADTVNVTNGGIITGATLDANKVTVTTDSPDKVSKIESDLTINNNGTLTLEGGETLDVKGSLTLGSGSKLVIKGDGKLNVTGQVTIESGANIVTSGEHEVGEELIVSDKPIDVADDVVLTLGDKEIILHNGDTTLIIVNQFKPELAKTYTVSNWGAITASRAVVNAVRGQRTNTGCIANGRGTAWAAVLGGMHDISSSEIKLEGAAVGADMKVGRRSNLGVAFSYVEGDVSPSGLSKVDQEGTYMALYGEHGLKKLSSSSCLSLDWVLAYGETESEQGARDWEQKSVQFNTRLNWNKQLTSRLSMNVFGGLEYYANESDTVDGVKTGSLQNLRGEIGVGARYVAWGTPATKIAAGCEKLVFHGELRYMNDMVRSNPVIEMNNARGGADNPGRYGMGVEAGATYRFNGRWSASANYGFNTMEDSREHRVNVGASCTF